MLVVGIIIKPQPNPGTSQGVPRTGKREVREHAWTSTGTRPTKSPRAKRLAFRPEGAESRTKKNAAVFFAVKAPEV